MTPQELQSNLSQFYGSESFYRWSVLFRNFVLTDGTQFLAENARAFWLMDLIASHYASYQNESFVLVELTKKEDSWLATLTDGNGNTLAIQNIEYSDFPLESVKLYVTKSEGLNIIMLPSEY